MSKIFISYRRDDSADVAGRIYDHLVTPIGPFSEDEIFKDVDSIPLGINFKTFLEEKVQACSITLVVIGPDWLTIENQKGQRRIDDPTDYVRIEVEAALKRNIPVIPLLVRGATMASERDMPSTLAELAYRNGIAIRRDPDFRSDMARLVKSILIWIQGLSEINQTLPSDKIEVIEFLPEPEEVADNSSPYDKLAIWLSNQANSEVTMTFAQVEAIIETGLPASAYSNRTWWANDSVSHIQSQKWLEAEWRVRSVNLSNKSVSFARIVERQLAYIEFYSTILQTITKKAPFYVKQNSPDGTNWHSLLPIPSNGPQQAHICLAFSYGKRFRIELYIDTGNQRKNKKAFDFIKSEIDATNSKIKRNLTWERIDNKRASRIALYYPERITIVSSPEELEKLQKWIIANLVPFHDALYLKTVNVLDKVNKSFILF
jgi:hypothetical protein